MTETQFLDGSKTVTRRLGWKTLKAGDRLLGVRKAMGLKKGEKQVVLGELEVVSVRREPLEDITLEDVAREGFPMMTRQAFVGMFCRAMSCSTVTEVTRIEFRRVK
jgi:hypothetical protein